MSDTDDDLRRQRQEQAWAELALRLLPPELVAIFPRATSVWWIVEWFLAENPRLGGRAPQAVWDEDPGVVLEVARSARLPKSN